MGEYIEDRKQQLWATEAEIHAASGRPVITSNIHGCLEPVENGVTDLLCEKQNSDSLYVAMERFCALTIAQRATKG